MYTDAYIQYIQACIYAIKKHTLIFSQCHFQDMYALIFNIEIFNDIYLSAFLLFSQITQPADFKGVNDISFLLNEISLQMSAT